jgi:rhodanese-related sulfurtransferase
MGLVSNPQQFLKKDNKYYVICQSGARSARACSVLEKQGYNVINVSGGTGTYAYKFRGDMA